MVDDRHAGDRRTDTKSAVLAGDLPQLFDFFDIDQERRLDQIGLHLHDHIGAARQDPGIARRTGEQRDSGLQRFRDLVPHTLHRTPHSLVLAYTAIKSDLPSQNTRRQRLCRHAIGWGDSYFEVMSVIYFNKNSLISLRTLPSPAKTSWPC